MKTMILFLLLLSSSFAYGSSTALAKEDIEGAKASVAPAVGFDYGFNPADFQALKGERYHEENILRDLQKLEGLIETALGALKDNKEFINLRAHIANEYICLLEYAHLLKGTPFHNVTKLNSLEEVITKPAVVKTIDKVYEALPILKNSMGINCNYELERWDFDKEVYVGRNPFFPYLTMLLGILFDAKSDNENIGKSTKRTHEILKKRHHYYRFIKPLQTLVEQVNTLCNMAELREVPSMLRQLKDMIYHDISYRYNLIDEDLPLDFPKPLKDAQQNIPWGLLSTLGAAAHWLMLSDEDPHSVHGVLYEAWADLKVNLQSIFLSLQRLLEMEHAFYQAAPLPVMVKPVYGHIKLFADWYVAQSGLGMIRSHIEYVRADWTYYDTPSHVFPDIRSFLGGLGGDVGKWKAGDLTKKHTFLKPFKRSYALHYMLMGGEMAKRLYKVFKGADDDAITMAFAAWKNLRDHIVHTSQKEGIKLFEARINRLSEDDWEQLIQAYLALGDVIAGPQDALSALRWPAIKATTAVRAPFPEDVAVKEIFHRFYINLFKLNQFIEHGVWRGPEEMPRVVFEQSVTAFRSTLKDAHQKSIVPELFLDPKVKKRETCLSRLGTLSGDQRAMWEDLCVQGDALSPKGIGVAKVSKPKKVILLENLSALSSYLQQIESIKETNFSRPLVSVEARLLEYYLILLRDSGNYVVDHLESYVDFSSKKPEMLKQFNSTIRLVNSLRCFITSIVNPKAHLHRFSEPRFNEVNPARMHGYFRDNATMLDTIHEIIGFLREDGESVAAAGAGAAS